MSVEGVHELPGQ
jgi:hypothetical protein